MNNDAGPYLVIQHADGYGDVFPLQEGERYTLGRANTNRITIKDELCSREHAEVYCAEGRRFLPDLKSLNGTRVNNITLIVSENTMHAAVSSVNCGLFTAPTAS